MNKTIITKKKYNRILNKVKKLTITDSIDCVFKDFPTEQQYTLFNVLDNCDNIADSTYPSPSQDEFYLKYRYELFEKYIKKEFILI